MAEKYREFVTEFMLNPKGVGAVAPSSSHAAHRVVNAVDWNNANVVVEYGPGTGVVTEHILARLRPDARFLAIEINARFAAILKQRLPQVTICQDSVAHVRDICDRHGIGQVDVILSSLPWSTFSERDQDAYLSAMMSVLQPGGQFVNFGYLQGLLLPAAGRFKKKLSEYFGEVRKSKPVWVNLPPAFLYICRR